MSVFEFNQLATLILTLIIKHHGFAFKFVYICVCTIAGYIFNNFLEIWQNVFAINISRLLAMGIW